MGGVNTLQNQLGRKATTVRRGFSLLLGLAGTLALPWLFQGCASTRPPTGAENYFFTIQTNLTPRVMLQTNVVTVVQTNVVIETFTLTNQVGVPVLIYITNLVPVAAYSTNVVTVTNLVAGYTLTPGANADVVAGITGALANLGLPGVGSLVTMGVLGLIAAWAGYRNRQYAGQNTALEQASGVMAQNIATFMAVLRQTPQGQQLAPLLQNYLNTHQAEAGVLQAVAGLASQVDPLQAAGAAQQILLALGQLQGTGASAAPKG